MSKKDINPEWEDENLIEEDVMTNEHEVEEDISEATDNVAESWEEKYNTLNDTFLRLNAEFDNYRKRTIKEKSELLKMGSEKVLVDVIAIADDFERALENLAETEDVKAVTEGVELIYSKFMNFLIKHRVKEIETIGEAFDVDKHEAITTIPAPEENQKGKVIDCIQKGYTLDDKVIRFPKVIVAK